MARFGRLEARDWARAEMRGVCNVIIPSYTSDLRGLNEAGIRHDVRREIELGFKGAMLVAETDPHEYVRMAGGPLTRPPATCCCSSMRASTRSRRT
jgi:4-hydroxy-tetrahydrodipicolinate synthase